MATVEPAMSGHSNKQLTSYGKMAIFTVSQVAPHSMFYKLTTNFTSYCVLWFVKLVITYYRFQKYFFFKRQVKKCFIALWLFEQERTPSDYCYIYSTCLGLSLYIIYTAVCIWRFSSGVVLHSYLAHSNTQNVPSNKWNDFQQSFHKNNRKIMLGLVYIFKMYYFVKLIFI